MYLSQQELLPVDKGLTASSWITAMAALHLISQCHQHWGWEIVEKIEPVGLGSYAAIAICPAGKVVIGGGFHNPDPGNILINHSQPLDNISWLLGVTSSVEFLDVRVFAICINEY